MKEHAIDYQNAQDSLINIISRYKVSHLICDTFLQTHSNNTEKEQTKIKITQCNPKGLLCWCNLINCKHYETYEQSNWKHNEHCGKDIEKKLI